MRSCSLMTAAFSFVSISAIPAPAMAQYVGGDGSAGNPWQIATSDDLVTIGQNMGHYSDHFIMTADIDMAGYHAANGAFTTAVIAPDLYNLNVHFDGLSFTGVFDGDS